LGKREFFAGKEQIHVKAKPGEIAEKAILCGDPGRVKWIAEEKLEKSKLVSNNRGLLVYTGEYKGEPITVATTGMGCPSAAIVLEELVNLGVKSVVRVGTCGALQTWIDVADVVVATGAVPLVGTTKRYIQEEYAPVPDFHLTRLIVDELKDVKVHVGLIVTSDAFYEEDEKFVKKWAGRGVLAVEMESSIIFTISLLRGVKAASVLVVNGNLARREYVVGNDEVARSMDVVVNAVLNVLAGI